MTAPSIEPLFFKSNAAAFEYACKYLDNSLDNERPVLAIVLAVKGRQCVVKFANSADPSVPTGSVQQILEICAADALRTISPAAALVDPVPTVKRGDLVMYAAAKEAVTAGRPGVAGVIVARVKPIYMLDRQAWQLYPLEH
jgi:hypothetical protein